MSSVTLSPNMNMPVPTAGVESGPQWALDLNSCLSILDAHDHTPGYGTQISPSGMNISTDLPFLDNNAISLRSARFSSQSAVLALASDLDCLYVVADDLYYNDGAGNNVRITQSGGVAGSPGSIANLSSPASASYVSVDSTFVWQSAANTPAVMDNASIIIRNLTANSFGLTLNAPAAMGANFSLTLPNLPGSQKFMTLDAAGAMSAPWAVDGSTLEIASSTTLQVKDAGITAAKLATNSVTTIKIADANVTTAKVADASITRAKLAAVGQQVSSSCGTFTSTSGSQTDVTNLTVTITTTGRPVMLTLQPDGSGGGAVIYNTLAAAGGFLGNIYFVRGGSNIAASTISNNIASTAQIIRMMPGGFHYLDVVGAGTYTYKVQVDVVSGLVGVSNCVLLAYELA